MSKIRGVFPLFLATAFGVANGTSPIIDLDVAQDLHAPGIWVFGPAFKEQRENEAHPKYVPDFCVLY